jgi:hypothetical protein
LHSDMVLNSIVRAALPDFEVQRADDLGKPEMITDKVIEAIFTYDLAVADLTENNPNVLYELGLRHMQEMPVIHIAQIDNKRVFDVAGMNTLSFNVHDWNSHLTVRGQIAAAAKEVLAKGYKVSNPVTASRASTKLAHSADSKDQLIAQMMATQKELAQRLASMEEREIHRRLFGEPSTVSGLLRSAADTGADWLSKPTHPLTFPGGDLLADKSLAFSDVSLWSLNSPTPSADKPTDKK